MKKPGERVFETNSGHGNLLALQKKEKKKVTTTANYISSSIVESENLGFLFHEWVRNN